VAGPFNLRKLTEVLRRRPDVFICSASFEGRCRSIADNIDPASLKNALICENEDLVDLVGPNAAYLRSRFANKSVRVPLKLTDPLKIADGILTGLHGIAATEPQNYLVDITTFTRESLLILLRLLRLKLRPIDTVQFVYAVAEDYSLGQRGSNKWLSKGIAQIRSVLGYPGDPRPTRKFHLVVLAGFEHERAAKLIDTYESALVSVGYGKADQSITPNHHKNNVAFHKKLCDIYRNVESFSFSLTDPIQTKADIEHQISAKPGYNLVVAAMNNKISTVGAALAAFGNSDIQLCYAQPNYYNYECYSSPSNEFYLFEIPDFIQSDSIQ
jgi:hypothetical protein